MKYQLLIVVLLGLSLGTTGGRAGATDITGTWTFSIDRPGNSAGPLDVKFVLKQEGEKITGTYIGPLKDEKKVTGTVKGDKVVLSYEDNPPPEIKKPGLLVTFAGKIVSPTKITGVIGTPFCNGAECKWTATKQKK